MHVVSTTCLYLQLITLAIYGMPAWPVDDVEQPAVMKINKFGPSEFNYHTLIPSFPSLHPDMPSIEESRCILVTGATSGIGQALALSLAQLPSKPQVIAAGRRQDRLEELKRAGLEVIQFDLDTDANTLKGYMDLVLEKYPQVCQLILSHRPPR